MKKESRRRFLKKTSYGVGVSIIAATHSPKTMARGKAGRPPREIWIATLSQERLQANTGRDMVKKILLRMQETLPWKPDVICLPETFPFHRVSEKLSLSQKAEEVPGWITHQFASFARDHDCYIICPIHTLEKNTVFNSAVVIDRKGEVTGTYHKIHPTVSEIEGGTTPGPIDPPVFQTDMGTIGIQICFDVNWPEGWASLHQKGAEIVFWPSAFPGGRMLNAKAWMNKSVVVTSTWNNPSRIIDITGKEIARSGRYEHWACAPVNLDKKLLHTWPYMEKIEALRKKYGQQMRIKRLHDEGWTIIESVSSDVSVPDALKEFDIPTHDQHIQRATVLQKQTRPG